MLGKGSLITTNARCLRLLMAGTALVCLHSAALSPLPVFHQDAYIWQRAWTPAVSAALEQSNAYVDGWRVLAAETGADGNLRPVHPDWVELARSSRPVTPVIRIDGQLDSWDPTRVSDEVVAILGELRSQGVPVAGVEIDYDCATRRLPLYSRFLTGLRPRLGTLRLSITALPAWLESTDLDTLLAQTDEVVLQVHAVRDPRSGLFDPAVARGWIDAFSSRVHGQFRVALPDYGARVSWSPDGHLLSVESEMPRLVRGHDATELMAAPDDVAMLLASLRKDPPPHLAGVVWFRLPTDADERTWSLATWQAVMRGMRPTASATVVLRASSTPGMSDVVLENAFQTDAMLPARIELPKTCSEADGANGYSLDETGPGLALMRAQKGLLHGHYSRLIGWARCARNEGTSDAKL